MDVIKEIVHEEHLLSWGLCYQLQLPKCNTATRWLEQTAKVTQCAAHTQM